MYMVTMAARISHSSLASEPRNAAAAPSNWICALAGRPIAACVFWIAVTASPSEAPGARLNEIVADGNWPMWLTTSGVARSLMRAMAVSGTCSDAWVLAPDALAEDVVPAPGAASAADALPPVVGTEGLAVGEPELVAGT